MAWFRRGQKSGRDECAIASAIAIFSFLLLGKLCLLLWNLAFKGRRPLADVPWDGLLLIVGTDLLLCFCLAAAVLLSYRIAALFNGRLEVPMRVVRGLAFVALVVFSVVSFQVARIYGDMLDVELLRSGDDITVLRHSIWAYVGPMPLLLMLYGLLCVPALAPLIARRLERRTWLRPRLALWGAALVLCVGMAALQRARLRGIDTFGVKDNAVVFFVKEYKPPFRPVDAPKLEAALRERRGHSLDRQRPPASLVVPGGVLRRDFAFTAPPAGAAAAADLNLIVIQVESTGAPHVTRDVAPNLVALADRGLSLRRHVTTTTLTPRATFGLYYSDYLVDVGTTPRLLYGGKTLPQPALAEVLRAHGYRTGLFHTGFLDYLDIRYLFDKKGIEHAVGAREMLAQGAPLAYSAGVREEQTVEEMTRWIAERKRNGEKFYANYLTECPHHPYVSNAEHKPFPDDSWLNRYRNSLHYTDQAVGKLIDFLRAEQLLERTLIVVVGDHGETVSTYPVGHGLRVSVEETRTPAIFSNPVLFPQGVQSVLHTSHLDVAPTIAALLGLSAPPQWLGRDLLAERIPAVMQYVVITHCRKMAVVDNGLMFVLDRSSGATELLEIGESDLTPVPPGDPRQKLVRQYRQETEWFGDWALWRHLHSAGSGSGMDGGGDGGGGGGARVDVVKASTSTDAAKPAAHRAPAAAPGAPALAAPVAR
ncbi:MAG TPA: sulfatase-like hydrolase/transferase [Tepidisphaeraceae bacterium]|nr:sulfatase-like hydrolase/transferase [Tepidisphaeraceae bacterium]